MLGLMGREAPKLASPGAAADTDAALLGGRAMVQCVSRRVAVWAAIAHPALAVGA
jgi:hypothetical protein